MVIQVVLHSILQRQAPESFQGRLAVELPDGSQMKDLLIQLAINYPMESLILAINGRVGNEESLLKDGDQVNIMPALGGG